ncbi:MAG TPA: RNA-binding S4 domain-containing protein [Burkholderiales bacterium]|nr:RNA-binding S4 domain-containing protein [Burkholderiales bacterium]
MSDHETTRVRIDKWLWAARFFKTRSIAAQAIEGGKVQFNGERTKPSKILKAGDRLTVRAGEFTWQITVVALSERRGPATEAQKLYAEEEDSRRARLEQASQRKAERRAMPVYAKGRPTKKQRRQFMKFKVGLDR